MKEIRRHEAILKTLFSRYHHYILTGLCFLFIVISMVVTGCETTLLEGWK